MTENFSESLLAWYDHSGRHDLPWQQQMTPYRVWVSEIMLQQTQVQTVIPYYLKFMARFPNLIDLAQASEDDVLAHWSGLGYYARGRNLHKTAQIIQQQYGGEFPARFEEITALPGIGKSTAGAILALAFKQRFAILDGNVKRVLCRYDAIESWSGEAKTEAKLWQRAEALTPQVRFDDYTQAIMDLGATLCKRSRPDCDHCPVKNGCQAYQQGRVKAFPVSKPKTKIPTRTCVMLLMRDVDERIALVQRPSPGIWGGLWSLPEFEQVDLLMQSVQLPIEAQDLIKYKEFKHTFSHFHLWIQPYGLHLSVDHQNGTGVNWQWFDRHQALALGLPAPVRKIIEEF